MLHTLGCSEDANLPQHTWTCGFAKGFPFILAAILFLPLLTELKTFPFDALLGSVLKLSITPWVLANFRVELWSELSTSIGVSPESKPQYWVLLAMCCCHLVAVAILRAPALTLCYISKSWW